MSDIVEKLRDERLKEPMPKWADAEIRRLRTHEGELERSLSEAHKALHEAYADNERLRELLREARVVVDNHEGCRDAEDCVRRR